MTYQANSHLFMYWWLPNMAKTDVSFPYGSGVVFCEYVI